MTALFLLVVGAILFYFAIKRVGVISQTVARIYDILKPIIYGFVIAYLLNPIVNKIEALIGRLGDKWKRFGRVVGVFVALLTLLALIAALVNMMIPQLALSIQKMVALATEKLQELQELPPILLKDFHEDVQQVMDEMLNECQFVAQCADDFSAFEAGVDWNRWMKVGSFMAGGLFTILTAGAALNFWNPAGWVMGALAILSTIFGFLIGLFKSKARKIADLNEKLEDSLGQACDNIAQQMEEFCENGSPATAEREATQGPFAVLRSQFQGMLENQNQMLKVCDGFLALNDQLLKKANDYQENVKKRLQAAPKR
jgi:ElaB/YqjD/DUF883 family membrane-anchored ribosome-binding protein